MKFSFKEFFSKCEQIRRKLSEKLQFLQCWKYDNSHVRIEAPFIIIHVYLNERTFVQESPFKKLIFNLEKGFILVNVSQLVTAEPLEH